MATVAKALIATLTALGTWGATALADGHLTAVEAFGLCGVAVAGLAVWAIPNANTITVSRDEKGKFVKKAEDE